MQGRALIALTQQIVSTQDGCFLPRAYEEASLHPYVPEVFEGHISYKYNSRHRKRVIINVPRFRKYHGARFNATHRTPSLYTRQKNNCSQELRLRHPYAGLGN